MYMVIKLSFSAKVGRKRSPTAGRQKIHSISVNPKDSDKGAVEGKNVITKRYTRCDGESKRAGMIENATSVLYWGIDNSL